MAEEQDVHISSISGTIAAWSSEATAKKMEGVLTKIAGQNASIMQLLNATKNGTQLSTKELAKISADIRKQDSTARKSEQVNKADRTRTQQQEQKQTGILSNIPIGLRDVVSELKANERAEKKRANILKDLMAKGMGRSQAESVIKRGEAREKSIELMKSAGKVGALAVATGSGVQEAQRVAFSERFDMVREMRQSGLLHGFEVAGKGFIDISRTISKTNFTFGEASDFVSKFSKVVGINGVKGTLDFVHALASPDDQDGMMQRMGMEFSQVTNMAGQYLETLRISGQLQNMSDQQMRRGMDSFMSNVEMTANVLKVSIEEAAAMMTGVSDSDAGLLNTMPAEQRDTILSAVQSMNAQGMGPLADLLKSRLTAGSEQAFVLSAQYNEMANSALGRELLDFTNQLAPILENEGDAAFQTALAEMMGPFAQNFLSQASTGGQRALMIGDEQYAAMVGEFMKVAQTYQDANKGIQKPQGEDITELLNREQQRQAAVLAEDAMNELLPLFVENLQDLTKVNREFAEQANITLKELKGVVGFAADVGTTFDVIKSSIATFFLDVFENSEANAPVNTIEMSNNERSRLNLDKNSTKDDVTTALANQRIDTQIILNEVNEFAKKIEDGEFGSMNTENLVDLIEQRNRQNKTYRSSEFKSVDAETQSLRDELTKQMLENSAALAKLISELNK